MPAVFFQGTVVVFNDVHWMAGYILGVMGTLRADRPICKVSSSISDVDFGLRVCYTGIIKVSFQLFHISLMCKFMVRLLLVKIATPELVQ